MSGSSRRKGRSVQREGLGLLRAHGWSVVETSAGQHVEDAACFGRDGTQWSVEVKGDQTASMRALWRQTAAQAGERGADWIPLLLWRIDRGGWWLVCDALLSCWVPVTEARSVLHPPASMALPSIARWLARTGADPLPAVEFPGDMWALPASDAIEAAS